MNEDLEAENRQLKQQKIALMDEALGWHNRVEQLETAIDLALGRLRQRRVFLNAMIPAEAERALAQGEAYLIRCMPVEEVRT